MSEVAPIEVVLTHYRGGDLLPPESLQLARGWISHDTPDDLDPHLKGHQQTLVVCHAGSAAAVLDWLAWRAKDGDNRFLLLVSSDNFAARRLSRERDGGEHAVRAWPYDLAAQQPEPVRYTEHSRLNEFVKWVLARKITLTPDKAQKIWHKLDEARSERAADLSGLMETAAELVMQHDPAKPSPRTNSYDYRSISDSFLDYDNRVGAEAHRFSVERRKIRHNDLKHRMLMPLSGRNTAQAVANVRSLWPQLKQDIQATLAFAPGILDVRPHVRAAAHLLHPGTDDAVSAAAIVDLNARTVARDILDGATAPVGISDAIDACVQAMAGVDSAVESDGREELVAAVVELDGALGQLGGRHGDEGAA